ncbi:MAG: hypothetical protein WC156_16775, partial [Pedobacter sp.]
MEKTRDTSRFIVVFLNPSLQNVGSVPSFSTYDKVGNRKTMTKGGATVAYVVDADNRMKEI